MTIQAQLRASAIAPESFRVFLLLLLVGSTPVLGQSGVPAEGFVWSETSGWINMAPSYGQVFVNQDHLSGFAWSESIGWIELGSDSPAPYANTGPDDWGVNRDPTTGALSGYAWSESAGWIRFDPSFAQVSLDPDGDFQGFGWSATLGWVHFDSPTDVYGGSVDFSDITVPTLGGWGLLALLGALGALGVRRLREPSTLV